MTCDYCGQPAEKVTGREIYPHRPDLFSKIIYRCVPCKAHVGCHPDSDRPLGRLANAELRDWKMKAHSAFDPIWKTGKLKRNQAYALLAKELGLHKDETHIGMFDVEMCQKVVEVAPKLRENLVRSAWA